MKNKNVTFNCCINKFGNNKYYYAINAKIGKHVFPNVMKCILHKDESRIHIGDIFMQGNMSGLFGFLQHYTNYINKGYGTQMMNMLIEYAKENTGFERINALIKEGNLASEKLAQKLGFLHVEDLETEKGNFWRYILDFSKI